MADMMSADMIAKAKELARSCEPGIQPHDEDYIMLVDRDFWYDFGQIHWNAALDKAKRQLGKLSFHERHNATGSSARANP